MIGYRMLGNVSLREVALFRYLHELRDVEGWLNPTTAAAMAEALWIQERSAIEGNVAEIGIHHGKSFIPILLAKRESDRAFAIDLFEKQHLNIDNSGYGNREKFLDNLRRFAPAISTELIAESSTELTGREEEFGLKKMRLFSVDGGHTANLTLNDLIIADRTLIPEGLCILDDILNPHWTGVITGLFRYLDNEHGLVPFGMFPNKLFMCRPGWAEFYRDRFRESFRFAIGKTGVEFHRGLIDVYEDRLNLDSRLCV